MKPREQELAIAKACGLTVAYRDFHSVPCHTKDGVTYLDLPDYLHDLNAMHEAEKVLDANQKVAFACYLTEPVRDEIFEVSPRNLLYTVCFPALHATAAQRAEAFLRTLNLWCV